MPPLMCRTALMSTSNIELAYSVGEEELSAVVAVEAVLCSCNKTLAYLGGDMNKEINGEARGDFRRVQIGRERQERREE